MEKGSFLQFYRKGRCSKFSVKGTVWNGTRGGNEECSRWHRSVCGACEGLFSCAAESTFVPESYLRMLCFLAGSRECSDMSEYSDFSM